MIVHDFVYYKPTNKKELFAILARCQAEYKILAGGTDLIPGFKEGAAVPDAVVDLKALGLSGINPGKEGLEIEACVSLGQLEKNTQVKEQYPALWEAVTRMATPAVRHRATIGGNLCHASPSADTAPPLLAYGAAAALESASGRRELPLEQFFTGPGSTRLGRGEILYALVLPPVTAGEGAAYIKHTRTEKDLAILGVAAFLKMDDGLCRAARIALGAVAATPMRAGKTEEYLKGKSLSVDILNKAAEIAAGEARPIDDLRASAQYRRDVLCELAKRALKTALDRAEGGSKNG